MSQFREFYNEYWDDRRNSDNLYSTDSLPRRVQITADILRSESVDSMCDVGCGDGILARTLGDAVGTKYGVDISETALEIADEQYDKTGVLNIEEESIKDWLGEPVDAVVCLETLEHLFDPEAALKNIHNALKPDGLLIASFPNFVFYKYRLDMLRGRVPQGYTYYDSAEHIQTFTLDSFRELVESAGFNVVGVEYAFNTPGSLPNLVGKLAPEAFAVQIVVTARPT